MMNIASFLNPDNPVENGWIASTKIIRNENWDLLSVKWSREVPDHILLGDFNEGIMQVTRLFFTLIIPYAVTHSYANAIDGTLLRSFTPCARMYVAKLSLDKPH